MRILIRLPNWLGDVVMATPFLRAVRAGFPRDEVAVLGAPAVFPVLEPARWYDRAIPLGKETGLLRPFRLGRALRAERFDAVFLLPNSWSSLLAAVAAGIPRRIGYAAQGRGFLLTDRLTAPRLGRLRPVPMTDYYLALAALAGCPVAARKLELPVTPEAAERAAAHHRRLGLAEGDRPVAINPGSAFGGSKRWTVSGWAAVIDHFAAAGRRVLVYGGPADRATIDEVRAAAARGAEAIPVTDAPLGDLCAHMRRCAVLLSTDSGGRHFGVAAGIPVVVVMGSTHPAYSEVDAHDNYAVVLEKVECWPCHLRECPIDHRCMTRIAPERVIAAAEELLAGRRPFGGARPWVTRAGEEGARWIG